MNRSWHLLVMLLGSLALSGCAWTYQYGGQTYNKPEDALAAHHADVQRAVDRVPRTSNPLPDTVAISLPSRDVLRRNGITISGSAKPPESSITYLLDMLEQGNAGLVSALRASNMFSDVQELFPDAEPKTAKAKGARYFVSIAVPSPNQVSFVLTDLDTGESRRLRISRRSIDSAYSSFIEDIQSALKLWGVKAQ